MNKTEQIQKLKDRIKKNEQELKQIEVKERKELRKKRTHRLIQQGLLIDLAHLNDTNKAILLGYLLEFKEKVKDNKYYTNNLYLKGKQEFLIRNIKYKEEETNE